MLRETPLDAPNLGVFMKKVALTTRESEVLEWQARGLLLKEIAHQTGRSYHTVEQQATSARKRLSARTTTEAVARAIALDLIELKF